MKESSKRIFLDYAASTPIDPMVLEAMRPYFSEKFGNPGSLHSFGQEAMAAVDKSRETIAKTIGADFREVIFAGSATEANNLVLRGILKGCRFQLAGGGENSSTGLEPATCNPPPRIIISSIEHESVLETAKDLEREGVEVVYLPVDKRGIVDLEILKSSLNDRTVLVSIMYANNEIGTVQPIMEVSKIIREFKAKDPKSQRAKELLFHTDAVQAFQFFDCNAVELGVDVMTLSAHKIYGPKGIGALYVKNHESERMNRGKQNNIMIHDSRFVLPIMTGGGQEFGLRSGTENVPSIVGFAKAVEIAANLKYSESERIAKLRDGFWAELKKIYPSAEKNGMASELPNILNVYFPSHLAEDLLAKLDLRGVAVSAGSACRSRAVESSYVIEAIGHSQERARRSIRFSFGRPTTEKDIENALKILAECLAVR